MQRLSGLVGSGRWNALLLLASLVIAPGSWADLQRLPQMQTVGTASLSVLWFDIYDAELQNPTGSFAGVKGPLMLKLNYLRDISQKKLLDETRSQLISHIQLAKQPQMVKRWLRELEAIWPSIRKGDQLAFYLDPTGVGHFYHNERYLGSVSDELFGISFLGIWLAEDSDYPQKARQLRGQ